MQLQRIDDLTENDIKKVALTYLKSYYKFRPRSGDAVLSSDMRGKGGIIADGLVSFQQEDGSVFQATFEATSYDTRYEVLYKTQSRLLIWDAITIAFVATAIWFVWAYTEQIWTIRFYGASTRLATLVLLAFLIFMLYFVVFRPLRRYRYIYAIEQFKQYHANEQWVVIGEDVFISREDAHYKELRDQCIYNGFGLLLVHKDHSPLLIIAPSRESLFGNTRKVIQFISQNELTRRLQDGLPGDWMKWFSRGWDRWFPGDSLVNLDRFRQSYQYQVFFSSLALCLICYLFWEEWKDRAVHYPDIKEYTQIVDSYSNKQKGREPRDFILDTPHFFPLPLIIDGSEIPRIIEGQSISIESKNKKQIANEIAEFSGFNTDILVNTSNPQALVGYDCARFYNIEEDKYLVVEAFYDTFEGANKRIEQLEAFRLTTNALWMGCFFKSESGYVLFLGEVYNSLDEAARVAEEMANSLARQNVAIQLRIIAISPK